MSKIAKSTAVSTRNGNATNSKRTESVSKTKSQPTTTATKKSSTTTKTAPKPTEEKVKISRTSSIKKTKVRQAPISKPVPTRAVSKAQPPKADTSSKSKPQPLRAKHNISVPAQSKLQQQPISKQNVMSTVHNVTVSSPPPVRKELSNAGDGGSLRERTKTRTLNPDEIVILKKQMITKSAEIANELAKSLKQTDVSQAQLIVKEPVAFDIQFDEISDESKQKDKPRLTTTRNLNELQSTSKQHDEQNTQHSEENHSDSYDDDFESYESDFETGSSTPSQTDESSEEEEELSEPEGSSDEASEETQLPVTVIHKEDDRKLDSGSYDMHSRRQQLLQQHQQQLDSIDTSTFNSDHLDSGISYSAPNSSLQRPLINQSPEKSLPKISKRGQELMSKIQLDEVTYVLFDLKPVNYEHYMKLYGNYNSTQISTQTNDDCLDTGIQTDLVMMKSIWTQHPPQFDLKFMRENGYRNLQNACGEFESNNPQMEDADDPLSRSLSAMSRFQSARIKPSTRGNEVDFVKLNTFLQRTEFTLSAVLNKSTVRRNLQSSYIGITQGYYSLQSRFLSATKVKKMFTNPKSNLIIVIHDDVENVYSGDFRNLLSVWNVNEPKTPFKLLSTWSQVCSVEICAELQDIIVGGQDDGSLALWDLKESYSLGVQFGDGSCYFPPTQTITPYQTETEELNLKDIGIVIAVKAFRLGHQFNRLHAYRPIQFASLHDSGIVTIWTLVNVENDKWTSLLLNKIDNSKMEYNSPSARFKLNQSAIHNLQDYLHQKSSRPRSSFEKTRSYFENDLFNDSALRELQEANKNELDLVGLRFTGFDVGLERIYISTNRDFIISCTKTLKTEKFKKIVFENSKGLFATALKLFWNEEYLIVGFSNGSVMVYNCNPLKPTAESNESSANNSTCPTPMVESNRFGENETGKSCAIQNIVRNERTSIDERPESGIVADLRPRTALGLPLTGSVNRIFDKQILLSGTVLRKDLVNSIEVTNDGNRLLALTDGNLRIYDFTTTSEIHCSTNGNIREIGLTKETFGCQNLTVLTKDEDVQVHIIK